MDLEEMIKLSEVSQRQIRYCLCAKSKKKKKGHNRTYLQTEMDSQTSETNLQVPKEGTGQGGAVGDKLGVWD